MGAYTDFLERNSGKTWFGFAVAVLASILTVVLPTYVGGVRRTDDMESHFQFAHAFRAGIATGDLYPAWANDNLGFGSVGIRFYPPASAYFAALLESVVGDWHTAYLLSMLAFMALGCFGIYLLVREWSTPTYAVFAAILYAIVPYHVAQIYRFFLYAEFAAMAVLPFCLLYLTRLCRRGRWSDVIPIAASCSLLTLAHIPATVMMGLVLPVYLPFVMDWGKWKKVSVQLLSATAVSVLATAFYWIRVVTELPWVAHSDERYTVAGYPRGPMLFPFGLLDPDVKFPYILHLDIVTILTAALLLPSIAVLFFVLRRDSSGPDIRVIAATSLAGAFAFVLLSRVSQVLWVNIELLQRLQYPFRLLALITVLGVASTALSFGWIVAAGRLSGRRAQLILIILIAVFTAADIRQVRRSGTRIQRTEFNELAERMRSARVAKHWWPIWAKPEAFENREPVTASNRGVEIEEWGSERRKFTVADGAAEDVRVSTFYYPYWVASVNGKKSEVRVDGDGTILLPIGAERTEVDLRFEEPLRYTLLMYLSLVTWLLVLGGLTAGFLKKTIRPR